MNFVTEIETVINKYSKENDSNTPDFILAVYLNKCLIAFSDAVYDREKWFGENKPWPIESKSPQLL